MYRDKTLIPTEAIRLCALGLLAGKTFRYNELAAEVRHFTSHITGPSLDMLGPSIELLSYEGLTNAIEGDGADRLLSITDKGQTELQTLIKANVRTPIDGLAKLVIALKFRFLHLLPITDRVVVIDGLTELFRAEQARLAELRLNLTRESPHLLAWLDHDITQVDDRIIWFCDRRDALLAQVGADEDDINMGPTTDTSERTPS